MIRIAATTTLLLCATTLFANPVKESGIQGGMVVSIGNLESLEELRLNDRYLVQGLSTDAAVVAETREKLQKQGVYGPISVKLFDGKTLPYVDNTVNGVVVRDTRYEIRDGEIERVLALGGAAISKEKSCIPHPTSRIGDGFVKFTKPVPSTIDEWTHFLHDSGNNAVANDTEIHSPRTLRWTAGPRWSRSHEIPTSVQGVVTSSGRIFTILDEGPIGVVENVPWQCRLIARDAFNGKLLWKVPLQEWDGKYGAGEGNRLNIHQTLPRRLVAKDDRVYITLRFMNSPVSVIDAATGKILTKALPGTMNTDEMVLCGDVLTVITTEAVSPVMGKPFLAEAVNNSIAAVNVKTGKLLWEQKDIDAAPYSLAANSGRALYCNGSELVCLDLATGKENWRAAAGGKAKVKTGQITVVATPDIVLLALGKRVRAFSAADGAPLWEQAGKSTLGAAGTHPMDVFVVGDTVWLGGDPIGYDLKTGKAKKLLDLGKTISPGHHRRCLRGKATVNYVIHNKRGSEFIDLSGENNHMRNNWIRMPCFTGVMPANGMLYVPPSQCFCYPGVLMSGYLAFASDPVETLKPNGAEALTKGPAYDEVNRNQTDPSDQTDQTDWPMYRHNNLRSGSSNSKVPAKLKKAWTIELNHNATQPVVVGDRMWIAEKGAHAIHCYNVKNGKRLYSFTAGGVIDSAPTIVDGTVLFGCRDGNVYCLRADDGKLAWRFRAAPDERQIVSFEQLESLWPVHGSILVQDNIAYFAAGRSSYLSGGLVVYGLDAKSGAVRASHVFDGPWPDIKTETGGPFSMEGARADIFVADKEQNLYMLRHQFNADLEVQPTTPGSMLGELPMTGSHLIALNGFLDDSGSDRVYWMHAPQWPGFYFSQHSSKAGQLISFDDEASYAVKYFYRRKQWTPKFWPGEDGYLLYADDIDSEPALLEKGEKLPELRWLQEGAYTDKYKRGGRGSEKGTGYVSTKEPRWKTFIPTRVRAMVLTSDRLVVAGPPDEVVEGDPLAAFENRAGAELHVIDKTSGKTLSSITLDMPPVFDGLSAANGRLFMATEDAKVICWR